jgi:endo-1,4-beta-xylanase
MIERYPFSEDKLNRFMNEISDMGLSILITEMDVTETADRSTSIAVRDQKIADEYARFLSVALDNKAVIAVLTWGLSDRYTWLSDYAKRQDGQPVRPLPLDADLKKTQAWRAIANAFQHAPRRPRPTRGSGASSSSLGQRWPARCIAAGTTSLF